MGLEFFFPIDNILKIQYLHSHKTNDATGPATQKFYIKTCLLSFFFNGACQLYVVNFNQKYFWNGSEVNMGFICAFLDTTHSAQIHHNTIFSVSRTSYEEEFESSSPPMKCGVKNSTIPG